MGKSKVLIVGLKGLAVELIKNIVLAGVGNITIIDHNTVNPEDLGVNFFLTANDIGKNVKNTFDHSFFFFFFL